MTLESVTSLSPSPHFSFNSGVFSSQTWISFATVMILHSALDLCLSPVGCLIPSHQFLSLLGSPLR